MADDQGVMLTASAAAKTARVVRRFTNDRGGTELPRIGDNGPDEWWAKIGESQRDGGDWAWTYSSVEVHKKDAGRGGWEEAPNGRKSDASGDDEDAPQAFNALEDMNGAGGLTGCGIDIGELPDGYELRPIPDGAIVRMREVVNDDGTVEHWFSACNGIKGGC